MVSVNKALGLGLIVLVVAFVFPAVLTAAEDGRTESLDEYSENEVITHEEAVVVETTNVQWQSVTVNVTSAQTGDTAMVQMNEGDTATVEIDGTEVIIDAVDATAETATLRVNYLTTLGWSGPAERFSGILPLAILVAGFTAIVLLAGSMIR